MFLKKLTNINRFESSSFEVFQSPKHKKMSFEFIKEARSVISCSFMSFNKLRYMAGLPLFSRVKS